MDLEQFDEFFAVREAACDGLRSGAFVGADGLLMCRLVVLPSFENSVGWDVRSWPVPGGPAQPRLFRSCWRMDLDSGAFGSPLERLKHPRPYRPTVEVVSAPIDATRIEGVVRRLQAIPIPLAVAEPPVGLDGTSYELHVGKSFCRARIAWWNRLPEEWSALGPVLAEMESIFESSWQET